MTDPIADAFQELRREYLAEAPSRLAELRTDLAAEAAGEPDAAESVRTRLHRLVGSGGSYGFPAISGIAREMEGLLATEDAVKLTAALARLEAAFDTAALEMGPPADVLQPREFGWRALVAVRSTAMRVEVSDALRGAGFLVREDTEITDAAALPPTERPDVVVLGTGPSDPDPFAATAAWTADRQRRPRAVILVEAALPVDRLRAAAAGADHVVPGERIATDIPSYVESLARLGAPPLVVLVADGATGAGSARARLEENGMDVEYCADADAAQAVLGRRVPDVIVLGADLSGAGALAVARYARQEPRTRLVPVIMLAADVSGHARGDALRAGVDDLLPLADLADDLVPTVLARGDRGRRIAELVCRDPLTGLLNAMTIRLELDHAAAYARRYHDRFALLVLDVDHFRRINERHGHRIGDRVLMHVASVLRASIRTSDLLGRHGGESFAVILRGAARDGAVVTAEKMRDGLRAQPFAARDGGVIPLHASVGVAAYGPDGTSGGDLAQAADRALHRAKQSGRNRVEAGG